MPDLETVLLIAAIAVFAVVLGGGAMQDWRDWAYGRKVRKHLRK
jgi:hypothetical protein